MKGVVAYLWLLDLLADHLEVLDQVLVVAVGAGHVDHLAVVRGVEGLDVGVDGLVQVVVVQLGLGELGPHLGLVHPLGEGLGAVQGTQVVHQDFHRRLVQGGALLGDLGRLGRGGGGGQGEGEGREGRGEGRRKGGFTLANLT